MSRMIRVIVCRAGASGIDVMDEQMPSRDGDGPYADHPVLSGLPCGVRQRIADQIALDRKIGAIKTLRDALDMDRSTRIIVCRQQSRSHLRNGHRGTLRHQDYEGDPFGGQVAMRRGVGGPRSDRCRN